MIFCVSFFSLTVLLKLLIHVKLIVECEHLLANTMKTNVITRFDNKRTLITQEKNHYCRPWRKAYHWGLKEDPINEDP